MKLQGLYRETLDPINRKNYQCESPNIAQDRSHNYEFPLNRQEIADVVLDNEYICWLMQEKREKKGYDGEVKHINWVLVDHISRRKFMIWLRNPGFSVRPTFVPNSMDDLAKGSIILTERAGEVHNIAASSVVESIYRRLQILDRGLNLPHLRFPGEHVHRTDGKLKIADGGMATDETQYCMNFIVEAAYLETFEKIRQDVHDWIHCSANVQVAIGIKVFTKTTNGLRKMILLYEDLRGVKPEIEFGIDPYLGVFEIPVAVLFRSVPRRLRNTNVIPIALRPIREAILNRLDSPEVVPDRGIRMS